MEVNVTIASTFEGIPKWIFVLHVSCYFMEVNVTIVSKFEGIPKWIFVLHASFYCYKGHRHHCLKVGSDRSTSI